MRDQSARAVGPASATRLLTTTALLLFAGCQSGGPNPAHPTPASGEASSAVAVPSDRTASYVEGDVIVRFVPSVASKDVGAALRKVETMQIREKENLSRVPLLGVNPGVLPGELRLVEAPGVSTQDAIRELMKNPDVRYAEPNYLLSTHLTPDDPQFGQLWGLHNTGQTGGTNDADVDGPETWDLNTGSASVLVGVIDTGVNYLHEDLAANMWSNPNEVAGNGIDDDGNGYVDDVHGINAITNSGDPMDDHGHGTHVSGTIGAVGNNGVGVVGVTWDVQLIGCKFLSSSGGGTTADAIKCFQYFNDLRAQRGQDVVITSNSWGGGGFSQALRDSMQGLDQPMMPAILHLCAAGNSNVDTDTSAHYPSSYTLDNIVSVAATDHNDAYASFSNYGATSVDLAAPGVNILSTWIPGNAYHTISGTSMATPHVSGAAALIFSANPSSSAASAKSQMLAAVDPVSGTKQTLTNGRLNLREPCLPQPIADAGGNQTVCLGDSVMLGTPEQPDTTYLWSPGGETTAQITVAPGTNTTYTLTATTSCGSAQDSATVYVDDGTGGGLFEDFESGGSDWTLGGLWHLAADTVCATPGYSSPVNAMYYGQESTCNYNVGSNSGSMLSPPISGINGASSLTFDYFRQVESYSGSYDRTSVDVVSSAGATTVFSLDSSNPSGSIWKSAGPIDLSAFAGETIQLRFTFASGDSAANSYTGWLVDDVAVGGASACTGVNTPPVITISQPQDGGTAEEGVPVDFVGDAIDAQDGDLSAALSWSSSLDGPLGTGAMIASALSAGSHTITASAMDTEGLTGSATITLTVNPNTPPVVTITEPADGSTFADGSTVTLGGSAADAQDGDLSAAISWTSSLDGSLGTGASLDVILSVGDHTLTATAMDSLGVIGSDSIVVSVVHNDPPAVTITAPGNGSVFDEADTISFSGTALDTQDGDLTASLSWSSSLDGALHVGGSFTRVLSVGTHTISASVTDSLGASTSQSVTLTVNPNTPPSVSIASPAPGSIYDEGELTALAGTASDAQDGDLSAAIAWSSSLDGALGTGASLSVLLSVGSHLITATVTDGLGATGSDTVTVTVNPNTPPTVSITSPAGGGSFHEGDTVTFAGSASDVQDGDLTASLVWTSSLDGAIGSGGTFNRVLSVGSHTITATATDSFGASTSGSRSVIVTPNQAPAVSITQPTSSVFEEGDVVTFTGTAVDSQEGDLSASLAWTSSLDGPIGSGASFTKELSVGTHQITAAVADNFGAVGSAMKTLTVKPNTPPEVTITSPAGGSIFVATNSVAFSGEAFDAQDGDVTTSLSWTSSLDGAIGTGGTFATSTLSAGAHTITASVSDSRGLNGSASVSITMILIAPPSDLTAKAKGPNNPVTLKWINNATNYTILKIERTTDPSAGWTFLTWRTAGAAEGWDYWAERRTTYYYRISACTSSATTFGCSAPSNTASAKVP